MQTKKIDIKLIISYIAMSMCLLFIAIFLISSYYAYKYPLKYREEIVFYAEKYDVSPALVASVICAESKYNANAISNKGAVGLMQILPSTALYLADTLNITNYSPNRLYEPKINIELGTYYLSYLMKKFIVQNTALCAYNAGEGNVTQWLSNSNYSKDNKLYKIPYKETQNYVKKVNQNLKYYLKKY